MNLSGIIMFNPSGSGNRNDSGNIPMAHVPVVLQEVSTSNLKEDHLGVAAKTDLTGRFTFTDVPAGSYRLIEAWGFKEASNSIVSFHAKTNISAYPADPNIFQADVTFFRNIYSVTSNELIVTLTDSDCNNLYFLDAPINLDHEDLMDKKPFEDQIDTDDINQITDAFIPSHWDQMSQDHALFLTNDPTHVYEHGPIRLLQNRLLYGSSIKHKEGTPYIYLPTGNYYIHYQTTTFYYLNCTSHEIRVDLTVDHHVYSGATSRTVSPPATPVTISGAAILTNDSDEDIAVAIVNHSKAGIWFSDTSVTLVKLR